MTRGSIGAAVSLALVVSLALAPTAAPAAGRFDGNNHTVDHGGIAGEHGSAFPQPGLHHASPGQPFHHQPFHDRFRHHRGFPFAVIGSPVLIYAPPVAYASPDYYDPPEAFDPPAAMYSGYGAAPAVSDAPPPLPRVVEYATGRYELRGDGVTMAYTWVWIPNPPTAPPPAPPTAPPPGAQDPGESGPALQSHLYRWTDAEGVLHLTDNWNAVPEQYRAQAKLNQPT